MKPISRIILFTAPLLLLFSGFIQQAHAKEFSKGLLWEINGKGQASYLLGTIHSDDPSVTNVPSEVQTALTNSQSFSAELDLNMSSMLEAQMQMLLPADKDLKSLIGQQNYRQAAELMAGYGMPEMVVSRMKPWAVAAQLMMPKPVSGVFLDLKLYQQAQAHGLKTYGLETVAEQMAVFEKMTERQQVRLLEQAIQDYLKMPEVIDELIRLYKNRDLSGLQRFSDQQMKKTDPELASYMESRLINHRNQLMVDRMQPRLKEGKAFIAVGALHLPGEQGILNLLVKQGYQLKPLY